MAEMTEGPNPVVLHEDCHAPVDGYTLCLQRCRYTHNGEPQRDGYRFVWKTPDGTPIDADTQAIIPSLTVLMDLAEATKQRGR